MAFNPSIQPAIPGNLPTEIRYRVRNGNDISTVNTISFGTDEGEVLVPTVIDGKLVSPDEAMDHYYRTGESFGVFRNAEDATRFANELHEYHASKLRR